MRKIARKKKKKWRQNYVYIALFVVVLSILLYIVLYKPAHKDSVTISSSSRSTLPFLDVITGKDLSKDIPPSTSEYIKLPTIKSIRFIPEDPTVVDSIKAEVLTDYDQGNVIYEYLWEINSKPITGIKGDILPSGLFKKGDAIRVMVTPFVNNVKGYTYESMFIVVHSAPPSLELIETKQKLNNTIELQLVSKDPDNDKVTFSFEEPYLEGMTIDKETGKITWKPKEKKKGIYKFRASATDTDGAKIIKTFEFKIE